MRKNLSRRFVAVIIAMLFITGCTSMPAGRRTGDSGGITSVERPLSVAVTLRFEDVPIPEGFAILRDQSFIYQDGSTRVGLVRYSGRANASQVITFFKAQMVLYNWNLVNIVEYGNITLNFIKSSETCVATIQPLATKTIISVVISPKSGTVTTGFSSKSDRF